MASFAVDGVRQVMFATGIVDGVDEWAEVAGKRTRTGSQATTDEGVPVWGVEVTYQEASFGRLSTVAARVQVPAVEKPEPGFMSSIVFAGLVAEARVQRASGALITSWRADGIAESAVAHGGAGGLSAPGGGSGQSVGAGKAPSGTAVAPGAAGKSEGGK